jgi:hypothetical protein
LKLSAINAENKRKKAIDESDIPENDCPTKLNRDEKIILKISTEDLIELLADYTEVGFRVWLYDKKVYADFKLSSLSTLKKLVEKLRESKLKYNIFRIENIQELDRMFFKKSNYLLLDGKPVVYLYASKSLKGNVKDFISDIKKSTDTFLIGDHAHPWAATSMYTINNTGGWIEECDKSGQCELISYMKNFDGWTVWAAGWYTPIKKPLNENYPKFLEEGYIVWEKLAAKYGKILIPSIIPGFINLKDQKFPKLLRDARMFSKEAEIAYNIASFSSKYKVIKIDTFNEFGEATGVEPTREEEFSFLVVIRKVFT